MLPLLHLGVVDIEGEDVLESELMAHALANSCQLRQEEDYMIQRGSAFVNEYARVDPLTGQRNDGGPSDANHLLGTFPTLFPFGLGGFEIDWLVMFNGHYNTKTGDSERTLIFHSKSLVFARRDKFARHLSFK